VADPNSPHTRIAKFLRMIGGAGGERRTGFSKAEDGMREVGSNWSDVGNAYELYFSDDKYSKADLQQFGQAQRAEGVEAGILVGLARANNGGGNGHIMLPPPKEMAEHCHQQLSRLNDWQRKFVADIFLVTRSPRHLSLGRLANLVKIYIETGGKI
jgi:hypothetical protein